MPTFEITAPDGMRLEVTGPEGGTFEEALKKAQEAYTPVPEPTQITPARSIGGIHPPQSWHQKMAPAEAPAPAAPRPQAPPPKVLQDRMAMNQPPEERARYLEDYAAAQQGVVPSGVVAPEIMARIEKNLEVIPLEQRAAMRKQMVDAELMEREGRPFEGLALEGQRDAPGMRRSLETAHEKPTALAPGQKPYDAARALKRLEGEGTSLTTLAQRLEAVQKQAQEGDWKEDIKALPEFVTELTRSSGLGLLSGTAELLKLQPLAGGPDVFEGVDALLRKQGIEPPDKGDDRPTWGKLGERLDAWVDEQRELSEAKLKRALPENQSLLGEVFLTIGLSSAHTLGLAIPAILLRHPGLLLDGLTLLEFSRSMDEALQKGLTLLEASNYASVNALLERWTEMGPAKVLFRRYPGLGQKLIDFMVRELPGEYTAETMQRLSADLYRVADQAATWEEFKHLWTVTGLATLGGGAVQVPGFHYGEKLYDKATKVTEEKILKELEKGGKEISELDEELKAAYEAERKRRAEEPETVKTLRDEISKLQDALTATGREALQEDPEMLEQGETVYGEPRRTLYQSERTHPYATKLELERESDILVTWASSEKLDGIRLEVPAQNMPEGSVALIGEGLHTENLKLMHEDIAEVRRELKASPKNEALKADLKRLQAEVAQERKLAGIVERRNRAVAKMVHRLVQRFGPRMRVVLADSAMTFKDGRPAVMPNSSATTRPLGIGTSIIAIDHEALMAQAAGDNKAYLTDLHSTIAHEFGHALINDNFTRAPEAVRAALYKEYDDWLKQTQTDSLFNTLIRIGEPRYGLTPGERPVVYSAAVEWAARHSELTTADLFDPKKKLPLGDTYNPKEALAQFRKMVKTRTGFDEYAAQRINEYVTGKRVKGELKTTDAKEKFWSGLATKLKELWQRYVSHGPRWQNDSFESWLEIQMKEAEVSRLLGEGTNELEEAIEAGETLPLISSIKDGMNSLTPRQQAVLRSVMSPDMERRMQRAVTRYNRFLRYALTLTQIAQENAHIREIGEYVEHTREWWAEKTHWTSRANETLKSWEKLLPSEKEKQDFAKFVHAATLLSDEKGRKLRPNEMMEAAASVNVTMTENMQELYRRVHKDFVDSVNALMDVLEKDAKIRWSTNMEKLTQALDSIAKERALLTNRDYFPLSRFGKYSVTVKARQPMLYQDYGFKSGETMLYELYESSEEAQRRVSALKAQFGDRADVRPGKVREEEYGFQGMPEVLLRRLEELLTEEQQEELQQILHEMAPGQSYKHSLQRRKGTLGFSMDAMRGYANYFMHFANHISRINHYHEMKGAMRKLDERIGALAAPEATIAEAERLNELYNHLDRHYKYAMNPGNEWSNLRAAGFIFYLGFVPRSALVNATQVPMVTYPYLAQRYGDAKAARYLSRAMKQGLQDLFNSNVAMESDIEAAIQRGIEAGFLDESLATELAAVAEGSNLNRLLPGKLLKSERAARRLRSTAAAAAWMFQKVEKGNRMVAFLAAYQLERDAALRGRREQDLSEMERKMIYERAYLAARDTVENTQYEYARWNRPEFMRGPVKSTVFLFYQYLQNTLYFMMRDPAAIRFLLMMAVLGGLGSLPFAGMILDSLDLLSEQDKKRLGFGEDPHSDIRTDIREFLIEMDANPDLIMHGLGRYSFGATFLKDFFDVPIPAFDLSGSLSLGTPLPGWEPLVRLAKGTTSDVEGQFFRATHDVTGAVFGGLVDMMSAIASNDPDLWKRVEQAAPAQLKNMSKAARYAWRGEETGRGGEAIAEFDKDNPEHWMEIAGQALGFTPTRISAARERNWAAAETVRYYAHRRMTLNAQFDLARRSDDREALADVEAARKRYNASAPPGMRLSRAEMFKSYQTKRRNRLRKERGQSLRRKDQRVLERVQEAYPVPE